MSEQDLHGEPLVDEGPSDAEAVIDERDELAALGDESELDVEAPEGDAVEQRTPVDDDTTADDDYPPH
jgi:hypothetical protein